MKTRNVHRGTTHGVDRLKSRKAQTALALAVSLWIATGGVASADTTVTVGSGETVNYVYNGEKTNTDPSANPQPTGEKTGYHTVIDGGKVSEHAYGGYSWNGNVHDNTVTIINGGVVGTDVNCHVYGGYAKEGNADHKTVTLIGATLQGIVYGGRHK